MPLVHVVWFPQELDAKRRVAKGMMEVLVKELQCPPQAVDVVFHDTPRENFSHAGVLRVDEQK